MSGVVSLREEAIRQKMAPLETEVVKETERRAEDIAAKCFIKGTETGRAYFLSMEAFQTLKDRVLQLFPNPIDKNYALLLVENRAKYFCRDLEDKITKLMEKLSQQQCVDAKGNLFLSEASAAPDSSLERDVDEEPYSYPYYRNIATIEGCEYVFKLISNDKKTAFEGKIKAKGRGSFETVAINWVNELTFEEFYKKGMYAHKIVLEKGPEGMYIRISRIREPRALEQSSTAAKVSAAASVSLQNVIDTVPKIIKKIAQITEYCDQSEISLAEKSVADLYVEGQKWVYSILANQSCPNLLNVVINLAELVFLEKIQMENSLRYQIAKVCRIFTECFVLQAKTNGHSLYPETQDKFYTCFSEVITNLSTKDVATKYELECVMAALATLENPALALKDGDMPGLERVGFYGEDFYYPQIEDRFQKLWFAQVSTLWWYAHDLLSPGITNFTLEQFYEKIEDYKTVPKAAFSALEMMIMLLENPSCPQQFRSCFFEEGRRVSNLFTWIEIEDISEEGIKKYGTSYIGHKIDEGSLLRKLDSFWQVRYRAVEHLCRLFFSSLLVKEEKTKVMQKLAERIPKERERLVIELLANFHFELRENPEWKILVSPMLETIEIGLPKREEELACMEKKDHVEVFLKAHERKMYLVKRVRLREVMRMKKPGLERMRMEELGLERMRMEELDLERMRIGKEGVYLGLRFLLEKDRLELEREKIAFFSAVPKLKSLVSNYTSTLFNQFSDLARPIPVEPVAAKVSALPSIPFGGAKWKQYFQLQVIEPPLPPDIDKILAGPCPIFSGKRVEETHFLKLIPEGMTLERLESLTQNPKQGSKMGFRRVEESKEWAQHCTTSSGRAHWVLMTNDVIPDSCNKSWEDQQNLVVKYKEQGYKLLSVIDAATCLLLEYVETGRRFYTDSPYRYTRCVEGVTIDHLGEVPLAVGNFAPRGLCLDYNLGRCGAHGVGLARVF